MKTYGKISHHNNRWVIKCDPYCMIRLKRIFERVSKEFGAVVISDTEEACRDLQWFMQRFPMEMRGRDMTYLKRRCVDYNQSREENERILTGRIEPRKFDLAIPLRSYQAVATEIALRTRGLLIADELGTGKTACAIGMLCDAMTRPALVVTLTHLPTQWQREIGRFAPSLKTHILKTKKTYDLSAPRKKRGRKKKYNIQHEEDFPDVIISNYHKLFGWSDVLRGVVKTVIFDECQDLRRVGSDKYEAARNIADGADFKCGLSATPIYNYGHEFFNVIDIIRPGALGTREEFLREWCTVTVGMAGQDKSNIRDPKAFGSYLRDNSIMIRRTRRDVGREIPPITRIIQSVDCDTNVLDDAKDSALQLAKIILDQNAAWNTRGMATREFDMQMRQATGIAKAPHVANFVTMLADSGEKIVLYGWHRAVYEVWMSRLRHMNPVMYTGSESAKKKDESAESFINGDSQLLIMSLRSGAGLDGLQNACHISVFGELDWSSAVMRQGEGRLYRDGQDAPTLSYTLVSDEGSDPFIAEILGIKSAQLEGVCDPYADVVKRHEVDPNHIRKLAQDFLAKNRGNNESL